MPEVRGKEKLVIQSLGMDGWNLPNKFLPGLPSATLPVGPNPCTASASMEKKDHSETIHHEIDSPRPANEGEVESRSAANASGLMTLRHERNEALCISQDSDMRIAHLWFCFCGQ